MIILLGLMFLQLQIPRFKSNLHLVLGLTASSSLWLHVFWSANLTAKVFMVASGGVFAIARLKAICTFLSQNYGFSPIEIELKRGSTDSNHGQVFVDSRSHISSRVTSIRMSLATSLQARAGQHMTVYIPSLTGLRGHNLPVAWWTNETRTSLQCILEPCSPLSKQATRKGVTFARAYFTGPHGLGTEMNAYGTIVLIASGFGISAQLLHIKQLLAARDDGASCTRHIHL